MSFYCRHGVNIGPPGGYDYLCEFCESSEPDPSPNDIREMIRREEANLDELSELTMDFFCGLVITNGSVFASDASSFIRDSFAATIVRKISDLEAALEEARRWAKNDDDSMWMFTRYHHHQEEIAHLEREEARMLRDLAKTIYFRRRDDRTGL